MIIKTKMTQKEFIDANMVLRYSKLSTKIFMSFGLAALAFCIFITFSYPESASPVVYISPVIILFMPPLMTWLQAKSVYKTNARLSEPLEYDFNDDDVSIKGESFTTRMTWEKFYKVKQTKNWIFIYQNKLIASPISKKDMLDSDIDKLKEILDAHKVKNNL